MNDMTREEAQAEAIKRWHQSRGNRGRLARYCYTVSNGLAGSCACVEGQGNSWREAFADARSR
jgi:hypothetical protein